MNIIDQTRTKGENKKSWKRRARGGTNEGELILVLLTKRNYVETKEKNIFSGVEKNARIKDEEDFNEEMDETEATRQPCQEL